MPNFPNPHFQSIGLLTNAYLVGTALPWGDQAPSRNPEIAFRYPRTSGSSSQWSTYHASFRNVPIVYMLLGMTHFSLYGILLTRYGLNCVNLPSNSLRLWGLVSWEISKAENWASARQCYRRVGRVVASIFSN